MLDKLKTVTHYIITQTEPRELGATKLYKTLWFADLTFYRKHGRSITGAEFYMKMPHGPMPHNMRKTLGDLKTEQKIAERSADTPAGTRREFVWIEPADLSCLSAEEVSIIHEAVAWVVPKSAQAVSDSTHDALWDEVEEGQNIPLAAACVTPMPVSDKDRDWGVTHAQ